MRTYILLACALLGGCIGDGSITYMHSADPMVTDGTAYDRADLDLSRFTRVELPKSATVFKSADARHCRLVMEKLLDFAGHPGEAVSIAEDRKKMGCAMQTHGDTVAIGTFGEYDTHIEGGAFLHMVVWVPSSVQVVRRDDLDKPSSVANVAVHPGRFTKQDATAARSAGPWRILPTVPLTRAERKEIESVEQYTGSAE